MLWHTVNTILKDVLCLLKPNKHKNNLTLTKLPSMETPGNFRKTSLHEIILMWNKCGLYGDPLYARQHKWWCAIELHKMSFTVSYFPQTPSFHVLIIISKEHFISAKVLHQIADKIPVMQNTHTHTHPSPLRLNTFCILSIELIITPGGLYQLWDAFISIISYPISTHIFQEII